jgi:glutamate synthase domain-containing protein 2
LQQYGLRQHIKLLVAGKIISGFDILKVLALGADACYSARGMMFSLGCIQALRCDSGKCPAGVATQEPRLYKGLDVTEKRSRVAFFHRNTIMATIELMNACGFKTLNDITVSSFFRRLNTFEMKSFEEIYNLKTNKMTWYEKSK